MILFNLMRLKKIFFIADISFLFNDVKNIKRGILHLLLYRIFQIYYNREYYYYKKGALFENKPLY